MVIVVVKRDGKTETFDIKKLRRSIQKAMMDAGCDIEEKKAHIGRLAKEVADVAAKEKRIETKEVKRMILAEFDRMDPSVSRSWRSFDHKFKSV